MARTGAADLTKGARLAESAKARRYREVMKPQQLISAGFAVAAFAAASLPAVGWTLLGEVMERPPVSVQASWEAPTLVIDETARPFVVAFHLPGPSDRQTLDFQ